MHEREREYDVLEEQMRNEHDDDVTRRLNSAPRLCLTRLA